jgi:hypothetical protein
VKTTTIHPKLLAQRGLEIVVNEGTPPEIGAQVVEHLRACAMLIPPWVQFITVCFHANGRHDAELQSKTEYRRCRVIVTGNWLLYDERYRRQILCHEIAHMWMAGLHDAFYTVVSTAMPDADEPARRLAEYLFDDAEEQSAESIGWLMQSLLAIQEARP